MIKGLVGCFISGIRLSSSMGFIISHYKDLPWINQSRSCFERCSSKLHSDPRKTVDMVSNDGKNGIYVLETKVFPVFLSI